MRVWVWCFEFGKRKRRKRCKTYAAPDRIFVLYHK